MKILHVHDFFAMGNSRYGHDICRILAERGHEVHVLAAVYKNSPEPDEVIDRVMFHTFPYIDTLSVYKRFRYFCRTFRERFEDIQKRYQFDVVMFNQPLCYYGIHSSPLLKDCRTRYIFMSSWAEEYRVAHETMTGRPLSWFRPWEKGHFYARLYIERVALNSCDRYLRTTRFVESQLDRLHPHVDRTVKHNIPCSVDTEQFKPVQNRPDVCRQWGIPEDRFVILTIRRLVERMGLENLIGAFPHIQQAIPHAHLVIGGAGPLQSQLESLAEELHCRDHITFTGYVQDKDMAPFYSAADVFVLPTLHLEGFGMVTVESMACGTPVIATPIGGIPEVLEGFDPELVLPGSSMEDIAAGVKNLFASGKLDELQKTCRSYVLAHYRLEDMVDKIEVLLCAE